MTVGIFVAHFHFSTLGVVLQGSVIGRRNMSAEEGAAAEAGPSTSVLLSDNPDEVVTKHTSPMLRERHLLLKADKVQ